MCYYFDQQKEKLATQAPLTYFIPKPAMEVRCMEWVGAGRGEGERGGEGRESVEVRGGRAWGWV
jgi:hypothetical protein